jgi:murein L,D-transpeptidase YafK
LLPATLTFRASPTAHAAKEGHGDCTHQQNAVVINASAHRLSLCSAEQEEGVFSVSLGRAGIGKRQEGDNRTPLGSFALGMARPSADYVLFIPVGYPTPEQRQAGFTGGAIGIHGPKRQWSWLGRLANLSDWTRGCIALNRAADITAVAAWIDRHHTTRVDIISAEKP